MSAILLCFLLVHVPPTSRWCVDATQSRFLLPCDRQGVESQHHSVEQVGEVAHSAFHRLKLGVVAVVARDAATASHAGTDAIAIGRVLVVGPTRVGWQRRKGKQRWKMRSELDLANLLLEGVAAAGGESHALAAGVAVLARVFAGFAAA